MATFYHAARRTARGAIEAEGLKATDPTIRSRGAAMWDNPTAVYAFGDAAMCDHHTANYPDEAFDVWAIDATDLPVQPDRSHACYGGVAILADVPYDRLHLVAVTLGAR